MKFTPIIKNGALHFGDNLKSFLTFLSLNEGVKLKIEPITPDSQNQRSFFEGAIVPLFTFYQEGYDYKNKDDLKNVREWLKMEFNGDYVEIQGKVHRIAKSTKGELNKGFIDRVMDYMLENGYQVEILAPNEFKKWRDTIKPFENSPQNYIDYLLSIHKLKRI